jgi:AcrR family transcriptional regulator
MTSERHTLENATSEPAADVPDQVLDAVRDCVLAVGVRRTTLTDVARRAGVSRMTLYRMVPDVETLLLALLTRDFAGLLLAAERESSRRRTARARLVAMTVAVARALPDEPLFRRIVDVDPELLLPYLTDRLGSTQRLAVLHVRRALAEGHADRSIRRGDLDLLATTMLLLVTPYVVSARLLDEVGRDAALRELDTVLDRWLTP